MNRLKLWVFAATLIGGAVMFAACSSGSDDVQEPVVKPDPVVNPDPEDNGANSSSDEVGYIECSWNGTEVVKTPKVAKAENLADHRAVKGYYEKELAEGAYYVSSKLDMDGTYLIYGGRKVDIILCDGAELNVPHIIVEGYGSRLRIFGQEKGTGKLNAISTGSGNDPGIGTSCENGGDMEFHGGIITAKGPNSNQSGACGIGGGWNPDDRENHIFNSITIYDGTINATGGNDAAGIGGCQNNVNGYGDVYIYGGNVTAQGGEYAAGIGGGDNNHIASINIYGGTVTAYSGVDGAGIGGGEDGDSGDINIYGGIVRAYGDRNASGSHNGFGAGIGSGQDGSVNNIIIKGGDVQAFGGDDAAGIGTGEEYEKDGIISGTIEIHGGTVYAKGKGYGAGIGAGEDATFGVLAISGGRVDAHAGSDCGPWSGGIGAYHSEHEDGCHIGWAGWERIYIGKCMRLWTYSPNIGHVENVHYTENWWNFVHQRPQVAFGECNHVDGAYDITNCPYCHSYTLQLK